MRYLDRDNEVRELEASGMLATVIEHEMDHLEGILFVDHISALKRNMILRKLVKSKKADKSDVWVPRKGRGKPGRSSDGEAARAL